MEIMYCFLCIKVKENIFYYRLSYYDTVVDRAWRKHCWNVNKELGCSAGEQLTPTYVDLQMCICNGIWE